MSLWVELMRDNPVRGGRRLNLMLHLRSKHTHLFIWGGLGGERSPSHGSVHMPLPSRASAVVPSALVKPVAGLEVWLSGSTLASPTSHLHFSMRCGKPASWKFQNTGTERAGPPYIFCKAVHPQKAF